MALDVKVGSFNSAAGVNSINVGFQPKLVILWGKYANTDYPANTKESYSYGASAGPGTDCALHQDNGEDIWRKIGGVISGYSVYLVNMVTGLQLAAQISQLTATGFDINFTTHGKSETIYYLALGGSDIANASVGSFDFPTGSSYSQNLGYQPDALILFGVVGTPVGTDRSKPPISVGFFDGTTQYSEGHSERSDGSADRGGWKLGAINAMPAEGTTGTITSILYEVTAAFNSTGFDLTKTVGGTTQAAHCFIAIKGPQFKVGTKDTATATGADSITGIGFTPSALLTAGDGRDNISGNYGKPNREFYGVSDALSNFSVGGVTQQDSYPDRSWRDGTRSISFQDYSNGVITGAAVTGFSADTISLNWDVVSTSVRTVGYLAIGPAATGGGTPLDVDRILLPEWRASLILDRIPNIEWRASSNFDGAAPIESLTSFASSKVIPAEWTAGSVFDRAVPIEWRSTLNLNRIIPIEQLSSILMDRTNIVEWLSAFIADDITPVEWLLTLSASKAVPIEWLGSQSINADRQLLIEWLANSDFTRAVLIGWPESLFLDRKSPAEWLASVSSDTTIPIEWLGSQAINADRTLLVEWRTSADLSRVHLIEWLRNLSTSKTTPIETLSLLTPLRTVPVEWLGSQAINADRALPIEWAATLQLSRDAPIDWTVLLEALYNINVEALSGLSLDRKVLVEWDSQTPIFVPGNPLFWKVVKEGRGSFWKVVSKNRGTTWKVRKSDRN